MSTLKELNKLVDLAFKYREEHKLAKAGSSSIWETYTRVCQELDEILLEEQMTKYSTDKGTFSTKEERRVGVSSCPVEKEKLVNYCIDNNLFHLLSIPAPTLNAFYKEQREIHGDDFSMPGVEEREPVTKYILKKNR